MRKLVLVLILLFGVKLNAQAQEAIFSSTPQNIASNTWSVDLGVVFKSDIAGGVRGVKFYKVSSEARVYTGTLWDSNGNVLATSTQAISGSGWQLITFPEINPTRIFANTTYIASYRTSENFTFDQSFFTSPITVSHLTALNSVYTYDSGFPNQTYNHSNYWADVVFYADQVVTPPVPPVCLPQQTYDSPVTVMPLGDSITGLESSYRQYLQQLYGNKIIFVGSQHDAYGYHEGHPGFRADELAIYAGSWCGAVRPKFILLHAGTNDLGQGKTVDQTILALGNLIDAARSQCPDSKILLAQIIPETILKPEILELDMKILALAESKNVTPVDQWNGFDAFNMTFDGTHPTPIGSQHMADVWYKSLHKFF